jgi:hypothetical protein
MSIILVFFEYTFDSCQDFGILENEISVEYIIPTDGNNDGGNNLGNNQIEATGFLP